MLKVCTLYTESQLCWVKNIGSHCHFLSILFILAIYFWSKTLLSKKIIFLLLFIICSFYLDAYRIFFFSFKSNFPRLYTGVGSYGLMLLDMLCAFFIYNFEDLYFRNFFELYIFLLFVLFPSGTGYKITKWIFWKYFLAVFFLCLILCKNSEATLILFYCVSPFSDIFIQYSEISQAFVLVKSSFIGLGTSWDIFIERIWFFSLEKFSSIISLIFFYFSWFSHFTILINWLLLLY